MGGRGSSSGAGGEVGLNDLYRMVAGSDSYVFDPDYQQAAADAQRYYTEMTELKDEISALREELKGELQVDPELGRNLSEALGLYSDKGLEIKERVDALRERQSAAEAKWNSATEKIGRKDAAAREAQQQSYQPAPVKYASQSSYKGFEMDTHTPYLQEKLGKGQAFIAEMSPKQYLQEVAYNIFGKSSLESAVRGTVPSNVKKYAKQMKSGTKFHMPSLNYDSSQQEGRHRALAAMLNGYDKIPVLIVPKRR